MVWARWVVVGWLRVWLSSADSGSKLLTDRASSRASLIAPAAMVIYGHAYALLPTEGSIDPIGKLLGFDYSGSLAVKIFFFLSGYLITTLLRREYENTGSINF